MYLNTGELFDFPSRHTNYYLGKSEGQTDRSGRGLENVLIHTIRTQYSNGALIYHCGLGPGGEPAIVKGKLTRPGRRRSV